MSAEKPKSSFIVNRQEVWITCEDENGPKGLSIKVRKDITNRERDDLNDYYRENIADYQAEWEKLTPDERLQTDADGETPRDREWRLLADYVLDWNIEAETPDGEIAPVPSPADGGAAVFELITPEAIGWILRVVLMGYRATGKANGLRAA